MLATAAFLTLVALRTRQIIRDRDAISLAAGRKTRFDSADDGRGRAATRPAAIPAKGWKDIAWRIYGAISSHRILLVAAGVTYYALLAIFPALAALVALYGIFADPSSIEGGLQSMSTLLPRDALQLLGDQIKRLTEHRGSTLGITFFVGLLVSLWSASSGMKALLDALNVVYEETEKRGFIKLTAVALAFTLGTLAFMLLALAATVVVPLLLRFIGLEQQTALIVSLLRWPLLLVMAALAFAILYRFGPSRHWAKWRWVSWGSVLASALWLVASALFSWYAANFGQYDVTYGTIGAAIAFLTWMWISTVIVLLGAQTNAEIEHQTARDSTIGPEKALGARHANMADTVGAAQS